MIGNVKWNLIFATVCSLIAFMFSWLNNPLSTASLRTVYCFVVLFILMFPIRFILGSLIGIKLPEEEESEESSEGVVGTQVNLSTPDDESLLNEMLNGEKEEQPDFTPLKPPQLVSKQQTMNAEDLAHAVRHLADEEGR